MDHSPLGLVIDFSSVLPPALFSSPCFSWVILMLSLLIASSLEPRQSEDIISASKFMPPL